MNAADALDGLYAMWVLSPDPLTPATLVSLRPGTIWRTERPAEVKFIAPNAEIWMRAALLIEEGAT